MSISGFTLLRMIRKLMNASVLSSMVLLLVLSGCFNTQEAEIKNSESENITQNQDNDITIFGVSPDLYAEAAKQAEKAKRELEELKKDGSLSATAKRVLAEAEEARENGENERYLEKIQEYRRIIENEFTIIKQKLEGAWILEGRVYFALLQLEEAQKAVEEAVELDPNNPEYLITLGDYLLWNGKYQEMEDISLKAVDLIKKQTPIDESFLASSLNNLGTGYQFGGKYNLAVEPLQQALEMRKKLLGEEHPDVAASLNNLAVLYRLQGSYEKAEPLFLQALEMRKKLLGEEHPDVAASLNNLANLYISRGRYEEAEPLFLRVLEIDKKTLGEEHPYVAASLSNLAGLYVSQGRYEEAEPLYLQALEIYKKALGEEHPDVANGLNNTSDLYILQGRYKEAELFYLQALEIYKKALGKDHPDAKMIQENYNALKKKIN